MRLEVTNASWARKWSFAGLLHDVGVQADLAFVARRRREHVGPQDRAHLVPHVVIHGSWHRSIRSPWRKTMLPSM